jgi:UTP--glucose-1-phosphate uridylyltransferase
MTNQTASAKPCSLLPAWAPVSARHQGIPKEMLPVVDKPLIQYAVEEAYEAGIRDMIFVTGRSKRAIEDHFDTAYELENELERRQAGHAGPGARVSPADMNCLFVRQPARWAWATPCCAPSLVGNEPFAVILADDLMTGEPAAPA